MICGTSTLHRLVFNYMVIWNGGGEGLRQFLLPVGNWLCERKRWNMSSRLASEGYWMQFRWAPPVPTLFLSPSLLSFPLVCMVESHYISQVGLEFQNCLRLLSSWNQGHATVPGWLERFQGSFCWNVSHCETWALTFICVGIPTSLLLKQFHEWLWT